MNLFFAFCSVSVIAENLKNLQDDENGLLQIKNFGEGEISEMMTDDPSTDEFLDPELAAALAESADNIDEATDIDKTDEFSADVSLTEEDRIIMTGPFTLSVKGQACPPGTKLADQSTCKEACLSVGRKWDGNSLRIQNTRYFQSGCYTGPYTNSRCYYNSYEGAGANSEFHGICNNVPNFADKSNGGSADKSRDDSDELSKIHWAPPTDDCWTHHSGKFLSAWTSHGSGCHTEAEAKRLCISVAGCSGINKQWNQCEGSQWTLRLRSTPMTAPGHTVDKVECYSLDRTCTDSKPQYHLAPGGAAECDSGTIASKGDCLAAVQGLAAVHGAKQNRTSLYENSGGTCGDGAWGQVPMGCSAQSGPGGDWCAHYKTGPKTAASCVNNVYQLVCTGPR